MDAGVPNAANLAAILFLIVGSACKLLAIRWLVTPSAANERADLALPYMSGCIAHLMSATGLPAVAD